MQKPLENLREAARKHAEATRKPLGRRPKHSEGARRHLKGGYCLTSLCEATRKLRPEAFGGGRMDLKGGYCLTSLSEAIEKKWDGAIRRAPGGMRRESLGGRPEAFRGSPEAFEGGLLLSEAARKGPGGRPEVFGGRPEGFERTLLPNVAFWTHRKPLWRHPEACRSHYIENLWEGARIEGRLLPNVAFWSY